MTSTWASTNANMNINDEIELLSGLRLEQQWQGTETRTALSWRVLLTVLLPPIVVYYIVVLLLVWGSRGMWAKVDGNSSRTVAQDLKFRFARLALVPLTLYLAYRAAERVDLSGGEVRMVYLNQALALAMFMLGTRVLVWGCIRQPVRRVRESGSVFLDAVDLAFTLRGIGWTRPLDKENSYHPYQTIFNTFIPGQKGVKVRPASESESGLQFRLLKHTLVSFLINFLVFDTLQYTVQRLVFPVPPSLGPSLPLARTIYPPPHPPHPNPTYLLLYSTLLPILSTLLSGLTIYTAMHTVYTLSTLIGITLRQAPESWPPAFNRPWRAVSVAEFWGKRWHQFFRVDFVGVGGWGVEEVLFGVFGRGSLSEGRLGREVKRMIQVVCVFLVSGLLHLFGLWGMYHTHTYSLNIPFITHTNILGTIIYFPLMGLGIIIENLWSALTGRKVRGWAGWVWTMCWVVGWGRLLVEAWARSGMIDSRFVKERWRMVIWVFGEVEYVV